MPPTADALRTAAAVVAARFGPGSVPFSADQLREAFASAGVAPSLAEPLVQLYWTVSDDPGDGGKSAVLIATGTALAALESEANLAEALPVIAERAAASIEAETVLLSSPGELMRCLTAAAGGRDAVGRTWTDLIQAAGPDPTIFVEPAEPGGAPFTYSLTLDDANPDEVTVTVFASGPTDDDTEQAYRLGCNVLMASRWAIPYGVMPGGGATYARAANALVAEAFDLTVTGAAARALIAGLETPLRTLAARTDAFVETLMARLRDEPGWAFDVSAADLVRATEGGPLDAASLTPEVIRRAANTAAELVRATGT